MNRHHALRVASAGLIASAALAVACSWTGPTNPVQVSETRTASNDQGVIQTGDGAGAGQVTAPVPDNDDGTGPLAFLNLEVRYDVAGSTANKVAVEGGTYDLSRGQKITLYATRPADSPAKSFWVDWGAGQIDSPDNTSCGSCMLSHSYPNYGLYNVTARLRDASGKGVDFHIKFNVPAPTPPAPAPVSSCCVVTSGTVVLDGATCNAAAFSFLVPAGCRLRYTLFQNPTCAGQGVFSIFNGGKGNHTELDQTQVGNRSLITACEVIPF